MNTTTQHNSKTDFIKEVCERWQAKIKHAEWESEGVAAFKSMYAAWYPQQDIEKPVPVPAPIPFPTRKPAPAKKPVRVAAQLSMFNNESGVA